jgi:hypothetical protein
MPVFLHGVAGILIGGAKLILADSLMKEIANQMNNVRLPEPGKISGRIESEPVKAAD